MANIFHALNCKIEFVDLSKKFVEELKSKVGLKKNIKYYSADLLIKKFKPNSFDYIIINSLWNIVPQESELKMFVKLQDILKEDGAIVFMLKEDLQDSQGWFPFGSSDEIYYFTKKTTLKHLREIVDKLGMQVVKERKYLENAAILIRKSLIEQREKSKEKN
jgi:ubiquinone/menaquinone biosynthesis C-methylase UbiE